MRLTVRALAYEDKAGASTLHPPLPTALSLAGIVCMLGANSVRILFKAIEGVGRWVRCQKISQRGLG